MKNRLIEYKGKYYRVTAYGMGLVTLKREDKPKSIGLWFRPQDLFDRLVKDGTIKVQEITLSRREVEYAKHILTNNEYVPSAKESFKWASSEKRLKESVNPNRFMKYTW